MPVLNSIPQSINTMNITMGLPLQLSPLADLFDSIFVMHENAVRLRKARGAKVEKYYLQDILKIIQHPFILGFTEVLFGINSDELNSIKQKIVKSNIVFFTKEEIIKQYSICPDFVDCIRFESSNTNMY